jgi:putative flippase GtrA
VSATVADDESSSSAAPPSGVVARLRERFGHLVKELGKFGTVGGIAFLIDLLIFNLLITGAGTPPLVAKTISTVIAATLAFVGNRFWTWRHRERNGLRREYSLYFVFNAIGLGIGLACLGISHYALGNFWPAVFQTTLADNISGQFIGTAVGTLFRFWSYRRFVFIDVAAPSRTPSASVTVTKGD